MASTLAPTPEILIRMSSSKKPAAKKPQRRFQFIDNNNLGANGANSTQVRRHVMQEYMREKRWESRTQAEGEVLDFRPQPQSHPEPIQSRVSPPRKFPPKSPPANRASHAGPTNLPAAAAAATATVSVPCVQDHITHKYDHNLHPHTQTVVPAIRHQQDALEEVHRTFAPATRLEPKRTLSGFYLTPQSFALIADISDVQPPTPSSTIISGGDLSPVSSSPPPLIQPPSRWGCSSPGPSSIMSAARTDPFNCLPMVLNQRDKELFDFYATVMPACSYGFERRHPKAHNWYLSVFIPEAMKSPVAFQNTILVHAANTQAWVLGLAETPLAIEHRARASKMLSEQFRAHPRDTSDPAISSTISAAALEDFDPRVERRKYAWMHWNAVVQKIRDRGGPAALEQNKSLRMLINWSDYILSGYNGHGSTFFFDHASSPPHTNEVEAEDIARKELFQQCEEFIVFLKCSESLALVASNMQNNPAARRSQPLRYSAFRSTQPLHNLLASSNGPRYTKTGQLKQIISRLAALMTINVAIWEYRYSANASEEFFNELLQNISYNNLEQHTSVEALLQILLSGSSNPNLVHTERPWLVGRLLKVAKRLSRDSWERLNDFLLHCLTLEPSVRPTMNAWERDLRTEILGAPLVSHVLPLMQS